MNFIIHKCLPLHFNSLLIILENGPIYPSNIYANKAMV